MSEAHNADRCMNSERGEEKAISEKEGTVAKLTVNNYVKGQTGNRTSVVLTTDQEALVSKEAHSVCV